jgi:glycosyltransferase involved in cell wall biosynthesis
MSFLPVTVIILTYNESRNIRDCLQSICDFTDDIVIVDSGSTDDTLDIAALYGCRIYEHPFENYSKQRNWALQNVDCRYNWILNVDADHRLMPAFKDDLRQKFAAGVPEEVKGFMASRRTMFMGRWIKHGAHYPVYHGVMFRRGSGYCEHKEYDQHFVIEGRSQLISGDIIDIITDSLSTFVERHNKWSTLEARDALNLKSEAKKIKADRKGNVMEQRRYQRLRYYSYPLFWRVFLYTLYRFVWKRGFLDGKEGVVFHFLQGFWFRLLVDAKIYESRKNTTAAAPVKSKVEQL